MSKISRSRLAVRALRLVEDDTAALRQSAIVCNWAVTGCNWCRRAKRHCGGAIDNPVVLKEAPAYGQKSELKKQRKALN
jgi:hypothetical protein